MQTETILMSVRVKRKKKLFVPYTIFMMKQEMWFGEKLLICIRIYNIRFLAYIQNAIEMISKVVCLL